MIEEIIDGYIVRTYPNGTIERVRFTPPEQMPDPAVVQREASRATAESKARTVLLRTEVAEKIETLPAQDVLAVAPMFDDWAAGVAYSVGDVLFYKGGLLRVVQAHTSQADWLPENTPALYTAFYLPDEIPDWVQPQGAHDAKQIGDRVKYNDKCWESTTPNNVWEPGVYGWVEIDC